MDDGLRVSTMLGLYNKNKIEQNSVNSGYDKNLEKAKLVTIPSILALQTEFEKRSSLDSTILQAENATSKTAMNYIVGQEGEKLLLHRIKVSSAKLKCSIKLHSFNMCAAYISNLAYHCVEEITSITDSDLLRLSADELYVILRVMLTSRRHSNKVMTSFILKWSKNFFKKIDFEANFFRSKVQCLSLNWETEDDFRRSGLE